MKSRLVKITLTGFFFTAAQPVWSYYASGLIDPSGKTIVPCQYYSIEPLGHGLFFLEDFDKENPVKRTFGGHLVDHDGNTVKVNVPDGSALSRVYLPPAEKAELVLWAAPPPGTVLKYKTAKGIGLCRLNGDIILEPGPYWIGDQNHGSFAVCSDGPDGRDHMLFTIDAAKGKRIDAPPNSYLAGISEGKILPFRSHHDGRSYYGYMARSGEVVITPQFATAGEFSPEGLAAVSSEWQQPKYYIDIHGEKKSPSQYDEALKFVDGYAIIGSGPMAKRRFGLIDNKFNIVLQPQFHGLTHMFDHTYFAQEHEGGPLKAITAEGKTVFDFPNNVLGFSAMYENIIICQLKATANKDRKSILFDRSGKIVTSPGPGRAGFYKFGMAEVATKCKGSLREYQLENSEGKVLIPSQPAILTIVSEDRILKMVRNNHFNAAIWKDPNPMMPDLGMNRLDSFGSLLADYDLIDMPKMNLEKLIGEPNSENAQISYFALSHGACGFSSMGLEFECAEGKVLRWREVYNQDKHYPGPWITTNVIYDPEAESTGRRGSGPIMKLISKH